uniref:Secreted protein n=1 Tax=Globodera rostochiensis TaxID=31243 RepID=A0A914IES9_GLORO
MDLINSSVSIVVGSSVEAFLLLSAWPVTFLKPPPSVAGRSIIVDKVGPGLEDVSVTDLLVPIPRPDTKFRRVYSPCT